MKKVKKFKKTFLTIVVPVYNESSRITNVIKILDFINKQKFSIELIVVNDGSKDETLEKLKSIYKKLLTSNKKFKILTYSINKGKGYALKKGILKAQGQYVIFLDIDLSTPLSELNKFLTYFGKFDVIIGTRKNKRSLLLKRQPKLREYMGIVFTILSQNTLNLSVSDFTCGFKCFTNKAAKDIFRNLKINRWGFDPEVLFIAQLRGYKIKEISVKWKNDSQTKVKFPNDIFNSFIELCLIKINYYRGKYK